jgi:hypothetical protein
VAKEEKERKERERLAKEARQREEQLQHEKDLEAVEQQEREKLQKKSSVQNLVESKKELLAAKPKPTTEKPPTSDEKSTKLVGPTKAGVTGRRAAATKNPIRNRAEIEKQAEEQRAKSSAAPNTQARHAQLGGYGILYALGADEHLFKKSKEAKKPVTTAEPNDIRLIQIKGRRKCFVRQVELTNASLNAGNRQILLNLRLR